jgi:hydroxymethylpyrimidine/phosphomethylpyrimidine kinase
MNSTTTEKHEIIRKINFEIAKISKLASSDVHDCLKNKLITPSWNLSLDSVIATTQHYESIMNQLINIQLKDVTPETFPFKVTPDVIINHIADILIMLSFVVEFAEGEEAN